MAPPPTDPRSPCLVGTARRTWRPDEPTPEPLEQWVEVARGALADAVVGATSSTAPRGVAAVDHLGLVHCQSWAYDEPGKRLTERLGVGSGLPVHESILAGTSPQRLMDAAATRMLRGEVEVALVVGAEALASRKAYDRAGEVPPWSFPHPDPPEFPVDLEQWYLPTELAHGVLPAWLTFALLDQARWSDRGAHAADRERTAAVLDHLNEVASTNPDAWFTERRTGRELTAVAADNRLVATPYTKRMTSFLDVDMAAANLLVTHAVADEWGVPPERRLYLRGWGFARDAVHLAARGDLGRSPAMTEAQGQALAMAGLEVGDVDVFDLYSCFPSAVAFASDALGLTAEDPRPLTVTGGLAYHGGPSSNYMGHAVSHLADHLRANGGTGMVTGIGMHMTKHVAAVWSTEPGTLHHPRDHGPQWWSEPSGSAGATDRPVAPVLSGPVRVRAASVVHDPGVDPWAVAICERDDGARGYARSSAPDVVAAVGEDAWVGAAAVVEPHGEVNELKL